MWTFLRNKQTNSQTHKLTNRQTHRRKVVLTELHSAAKNYHCVRPQLMIMYQENINDRSIPRCHRSIPRCSKKPGSCTCSLLSKYYLIIEELHDQFKDEVKNKIDTQANEYRKTKHQQYIQAKRKKVLIASDSMCNQLDETRMSNDKFDVNIHCWGGCNIHEMLVKVKPILDKKSYDVVVLQVGTNDSTFKTSNDMLNDIIRLKQNIENTYACEVVVSNIIDRLDNAKARITGKRFNEKLSQLQIRVLDHSNITGNYLGKKGLHLISPKGTAILAKNVITFLRNL